MMGERFIFIKLKLVEGGKIAFVGMSKGKFTCIGNIDIPSLASIENILNVEGLKYNLLSVSLFCDSGYIVSFNKDQCIVKIEDGKSFFTAGRHNNLYKIDLIDLSKQN